VSDRDTNFEQNLGRLLQTACGPQARAKPAMRDQLRQTLLAELRPQFLRVEFPTSILGVLSGALLLLVAAWAASGLGRGLSLTSHSAWFPFAALVLLNLLCMPVASLIIILRRKYA
jgi:hypothetical protein